MSLIGLRRAPLPSEATADELDALFGWGGGSEQVPGGASRKPSDPLAGIPPAPLWQPKRPTNETSHHAER